MNKKQLADDMKKAMGNSFVTRKELSSYLNLKDAKSVDVYLHGLPSINQRYFIPDVAEQIIENMKWR